MKTERISNLSLTTITRFTKEQLLQRLEEQMSSARYALGFVQDSEILRDIEMDLSLAEIARECLGARPVYFVEIEGDQDINAGRVEGKTRFDLGLLPDGINFLYANPPVVNSDPIYQVQYGNDWRDVERGQYDDHAAHGSPVRIVYAAPPAPTVTFYRDGIEAAAMWVSQQRDAYDSEHGRHDPDTGSFEFGNDAQRDYSATLEEIAEGIRALHPNTAPPAPIVPIVPEEKPMPKASNMFAIDAVGAIAEARGWNACRAAMLQGSQPVSKREKVRREHAEWSDATFGNVGPVGPLKHLSKEALEAAAEPGDLSEWADMQFLLWDAQKRAGISDDEITAAMEEKLKVNMARQWPEPKDGEPRLHIKEQSESVLPEIECDICGHVSTDPEGRHHCCEDNSND